jgi:hypothetical protein
MRFCRIVSILILVFLTLGFGNSKASQKGKPRIVGFRVGFPGAESDREFMQYEYFADYSLPFRIGLLAGAVLDPGIDIAYAALKGENKSGVIFSGGPTGNIELLHNRAALTFGSRMALLTQSRFAKENLGGKFQFISHLGINLRLSSRLLAGYHFQHMSNASLARPNPGLNLHTVSLMLSLQPTSD